MNNCNLTGALIPPYNFPKEHEILDRFSMSKFIANTQVGTLAPVATIADLYEERVKNIAKTLIESLDNKKEVSINSLEMMIREIASDKVLIKMNLSIKADQIRKALFESLIGSLQKQPGKEIEMVNFSIQK